MSMRNMMIALALAATGLSWGDTRFVPDPTIDASFSYSSTLTEHGDPDSSITVTGKVSLSMNHVISFGEGFEADMQPDTTVSIGIGPSVYAVLLGEDPEFEAGDKSVTIAKDFGPGLDLDNLPAVLTAEWGNGQLEISLTAKTNFSDSVPPAMTFRSASKRGTKSDNVLSMTSHVEHGGSYYLTAIANMATDMKFSGKGAVSADGAINAKSSESYKSKRLVVDGP